MKSFLLAALLCAMASAVAAKELSLNEISNIMNRIGKAETSFTQFNADGSRSKGKLYINRPGRMRFEYEGKGDLLVVAGGGNVAIFDGPKDKNPESYPLKRTPLNILLERRVDVKQSKMVTGKTYDGKLTTVLAQDPKHPEYGTIAMRFGGSPATLKEWTIVNEFGEQTTVKIGELQKVDNLSNFLFDINYERQRRK